MPLRQASLQSLRLICDATEPDTDPDVFRSPKAALEPSAKSP